MTSNKCRCGHRETALHLLVECKELEPARRAIKARLIVRTLTLRVLLYTEIGIETTLVFLKETSIYIRKWHLNRALEEEAEEEGEERDREEEEGRGRRD